MQDLPTLSPCLREAALPASPQSVWLQSAVRFEVDFDISRIVVSGPDETPVGAPRALVSPVLILEFLL